MEISIITVIVFINIKINVLISKSKLIIETNKNKYPKIKTSILIVFFSLKKTKNTIIKVNIVNIFVPNISKYKDFDDRMISKTKKK